MLVGCLVVADYVWLTKLNAIACNMQTKENIREIYNLISFIASEFCRHYKKTAFLKYFFAFPLKTPIESVHSNFMWLFDNFNLLLLVLNTLWEIGHQLSLLAIVCGFWLVISALANFSQTFSSPARLLFSKSDSANPELFLNIKRIPLHCHTCYIVFNFAQGVAKPNPFLPSDPNLLNFCSSEQVVIRTYTKYTPQIADDEVSIWHFSKHIAALI